MARVSVVVSTANSKEALLTTVHSILEQSYTDFDLLISDDGSSDGTGLELITKLGPDPARAAQVWRDTLREDAGTRSIQMMHRGTLIHYLHQVSSRGLGTANNRAIGFAGGEFIAFVSAGDILRPRKLAGHVELLDRHVDVAACLEAQVAKKGSKQPPGRKRPTLVPITFEELLECPGLRLSGALLRQQCLDGGEPPFDENLPGCEEYDFWLRVGSRFPLGRLAEPLQTSTAAPEVKEWGLERFRVYSLEKAYQGGHLSPTMRYRVAEELVRECDHLVEGYRRRDNQERANFYDRKRKRFALEVAKLDVSDPVFTPPRSGRRTLTETTLGGAPA
jgi:glycosyltransferase involved in cell wall biosynthesis